MLHCNTYYFGLRGNRISGNRDPYYGYPPREDRVLNAYVILGSGLKAPGETGTTLNDDLAFLKARIYGADRPTRAFYEIAAIREKS